MMSDIPHVLREGVTAAKGLLTDEKQLIVGLPKPDNTVASYP